VGFQQDQMANPIVVHPFVIRDCLNDNDASTLVKQISIEIATAQWEDDQVYVDICQASLSKSELQSNKDDELNDLSKSFSGLYGCFPLLSSFSIGPKDKPGCAGSFTGFIKHANEIYGLTYVKMF